MTSTTSQDTGPLRTVLAHRAAFGRSADGDLRIHTVSQGTHAPLSVLDGTGHRIAEAALTGAGGAWAVATKASGNGCLVGTYFDGGIFDWDGEHLTALGRPTPETTYVWDIVTLADGTSLAATYPDAAIVAHHDDTGFRVLRRFGTDEILYARAVCVDLDRRMVWCGIGVTPCRVVGFPLDDPESATVELTGLPDHLVPSQLAHLGERIWLRAGSELWSFDPQDPVAEQVTVAEGGVDGYLSPSDGGRAWTTSDDGGLLEIDLEQRTAVRTIDLGVEGPLLGSEVVNGVLTGLIGHQRPVLVRIDVASPTARVLWTEPTEVKAVPSHMGDLIAVPGTTDLMLSAGQQGDIVRWSRTADELSDPVTIGQVESWGWGADEVLYAGTYPYARLVQVDPQRFDQPRILADLHDSHHQSRPIVVHPGDGAVWMGSTPGYGLRDGALTRADLATGEVTVMMMADETVHAIALDGTALLVGTSPEAGTGTPAHEGQGRLLRVDPVTLEVLDERAAPGGSRTLAAIGRFADRWWLLADHGLWQFDPQTLEAEHVVDLGVGSSGRGEILAHGQHLVVRVNGAVWWVDPSGQAERLTTGCHKITIVEDEIWAIVQPEDGTTMSDLRRIRLV